MVDIFITNLKEHAFNVLIIIVIGALLYKFAMLSIKQFVRRAVHTEKLKTKHEEKQREQTLIGVIGAGVKFAIFVITSLSVLGELDANIGPLLAGASIAGVALGFGAQSMVKNFLAGIFILLENQYRIGDVVKINDQISGKVEKVSLRYTVLRDLDGHVHHIPNGDISIATNMTMEYSNVNLDITVAYDTDIEKLEALINKIGQEMDEDEYWGRKIIEAPHFLRITDFAESGMVVKILAKTAPLKQWDVAGELRKRLKINFDKKGIELPYPHRIVQEVKANPKKK